MNINLFSNKYEVRRLKEEDLNMIYSLCVENTEYYKHCPPFVTTQSIISDMNALPPRKTIEDKYYIGYFLGDSLVAVMDLIDNCPEANKAFIGFFMVKKSLHRNKIGFNIIEELSSYLKDNCYNEIRLGCIDTNKTAYSFWEYNGFVDTNLKNVTDLYTVKIMKKMLG